MVPNCEKNIRLLQMGEMGLYCANLFIKPICSNLFQEENFRPTNYYFPWLQIEQSLGGKQKEHQLE